MSTMVFLLVVIAAIAVLAVLKAKSKGGTADEAWPF